MSEWKEHDSLPDRWINANGAEIIKERPLPATLEEALAAPTSYVLKMPGQLWRDVESFDTLEGAKRAALSARKEK